MPKLAVAALITARGGQVDVAEPSNSARTS